MTANETEIPLRPTFYFAALGLDEDFDAVTAAEVKSAYAALASNGLHPDHGGDARKWTLITAAYNELKAIYGKKRGRYTKKSDILWLRDYIGLYTVEPQSEPAPEPKKTTKVRGSGYNSAHPTGTQSDSSQRCNAETKSGPCIRPANHPHGHMSAEVRDRKVAAAKAKKAATAASE